MNSLALRILGLKNVAKKGCRLTMKSLLILCRGNICRSPMAAGFITHHLTQPHSSMEVSSAGINAIINYPADVHAQAVMKQYDIDLSHHRARQLTDTLVRKANLILVMTASHLDTVTKQFITAKGKTFLLGHWGNREIPDPFMQPYEAFEKTYAQIELSWQEWKTRI